jgi:hypothetical protein
MSDIITEIGNITQPVKGFTGHAEPALEPLQAARAELEGALERLREHRPRVVGDGALHQAVLDHAREAAGHLHEVLNTGVPADAVEDTRHALEQLTGVITKLERPGVAPGAIDPAAFEVAIDGLRAIEQRLHSKDFVGFG